MSTTSQQIEEIDQQDETLTLEYKKLDQARHDLMAKREELMVKFVSESKLLQGTKWKVSTSRMLSVEMALIPLSKHHSPDIDNVVKLLQTGYHCSIPLQEGVILRVDDNDISLKFKSSSLVIPFIKQHEIVVVTLDIRDQIDKLKKNVSDLEKILEMVGS